MTTESSCWRVEFYIDARGTSPVEEFLNGLQPGERAKADRYMRLLCEFGVQLGMPHAKALKGHKPLWELRPLPIRLLYFAHTGHRFIILHAFRKRSGRTRGRDIDIAERRMAEIREEEE
jgi:phage-related protein